MYSTTGYRYGGTAEGVAGALIIVMCGCYFSWADPVSRETKNGNKIEPGPYLFIRTNIPKTMSLTRNLYREDEVLAALRLSLIRGNAAEALDWAQEATDSDMDIKLFQTLLSVWLNYVGVQNISWLGWLIEVIEDSPTEHDIIALVTELARSPKDTSVFALQVLGMTQTTTTPDYVKRNVLSECLKERDLNEHETAFVRAVLQRKSEFAWNLSAPLWETGRAEELLCEIHMIPLIEKISEVLEPIWSAEFVWPFRAFAILVATSRAELKEVAERGPLDQAYVAEWNRRATLSMRKRRILTVPTDCLYWHTERGRMAPRAQDTATSTESDIMLDWRRSLSMSPFWLDKLHRSQHDTYFPDDIPDEWSSKDRQKSHGFSTEGNTFQRYLEVFWATAPSKLIWNGTERAVKKLAECWNQPPESFEAGITDAYNRLEIHIGSWDLSPKRVDYRHVGI